jgi:hypothetical protein
MQPPARRPPSGRAFGAALLAAAAATAHAADAISTDRPDFVESSDVVGRGRVQVEIGLLRERAAAGGVESRVVTTPTLLRVGVSDSVELRLETDGHANATVQDTATQATQTLHGWSDLSLGAKWHVRDGDESRGTPSVAWLLHVDVDSGSAPLRGQGLRPSLRGVAEWDLPHELSLGVMAGALLDRNAEGHRYASGILAVTFGQAWTPDWHTFLEVAGQQLASRRNGGSVVTFDAGVAWVVTSDVQLDLSAARGLTSESPDLQWGVGLSIRF